MTEILGSSAAIPKSTKRQWDRRSGEKIIQPYEGADSAILTLYNNLKAAAEASRSSATDTISYDPGRGKAMLEVVYTDDGVAVYELFSNELSKSVKQAPYFTTTDPALTPAQIEEVTASFVAGLTSAQSGLAGKQAELLQIMNMGVEEYFESAWVLRSTQICGWKSSVTAAMTNVNRKVDAPDISGSLTLINALPAGEWLYKAPIIRTDGPKRWVIVREWWWANKWSAVLYGGSGTP